LVEIKNLTKLYGSHKAVDDLSITVEDGQIYGFLGPNGAGKSTTMNIMTGCLAATSGTVTINGFDILEQPKEAKKCIGYLPEQPPLYPDMTPREYLGFVCGLKGIKGSDVEGEIKRVAELTRITDHLDRLIMHLSKGYKQRVGIAQAILGQPKLVILDEPTVGLDPKQITEIRELIRSLGGTHTVILSSHILSEISSVCDKIMIIRKGRLVACDTPEGLSRSTLGDVKLRLTVDPCGGDAQAVVSAVKGVSGVEASASSRDGGCVDLTASYSPDLDLRRDIASALAKSGMLTLSMQEVRLSLEDIFLELTAPDAPADDISDETDTSDEADTSDEKETTDNDGNI